jgi:hypothetical protein
MGHINPMRLRLLAAELRDESARIGRTVRELEEAASLVARPDAVRMYLYAAAALLETYYTGIEKALSRIATVIGTMPAGQGWHRQLLRDSTLDLPGVRPGVLSAAAETGLERFLGFRHRFRNLYLFDLDRELTLPLLREAPALWRQVHGELAVFADTMERLASELEQPAD